MENHHLGYFITETLYFIPEGKGLQEKNEITTDTQILRKLIVVTQSLSNESKSLLEKIVTAIKLDISSIQILHELPTEWKSTKYLVFLPESKKELYRNFTIGKSEIIYSAPLEHLQVSREDKKMLWEALKKWT